MVAEFGAVELQRHILPAMQSTIQETPILGIVIIHIELSKATTNTDFHKRVVWCH
jgi:hypothetical protein